MIIVGLGNPGKEYKKTRHNAGFMALDLFAKEHGFPEFKASSKYESSVSEGKINGLKVILVKPQTFMNNSGKAVKALLGNLVSKNLETKFPSSFVLVHDDIDILLGQMKFSKGRGSAGHKGVESIMRELGTKDFTRIRIGIQPLAGKPLHTEEFVLQSFSQEELPFLEQALADTSHWLLNLVE